MGTQYLKCVASEVRVQSAGFSAQATGPNLPGDHCSTNWTAYSAAVKSRRSSC